jgi:di/tricarboxylate transporter
MEMYIVLAVLAGALVLFASELLPIDVVALLILLSLIAFGVLAPEEAVHGFANPAVITIAAMFVLSAGLLRTGALSAVAQKVMDYSQGQELRFTALLMITVAVMSAFINNTPVVVIFLPLVLSLANRSNILPSKVLIPLSYGAILGGTCTLIGTSTNLLIHSMAEEHGFRGLGMFEFSRLGLVYVAVGVTYIYFIGHRFLPAHGTVTTYTTGRIKEYLTEVAVPPDSPLLGKDVEEVVASFGDEVQVFQLIRGEEIFWPSFKDLDVQEGDAFLIKGEVNPIMSLLRSPSVTLAPGVQRPPSPTANQREMALAELVINPNSTHLGATLDEVHMPDRYGVQVLAIQRHGAHLREKLSEIRLRVGDVLLILGSEGPLSRLANYPDFIVLEEVRDVVVDRRKARLALGVTGAVVILAALKLQPIMVLALAGAVLMVITGCISAREAYRSVDKSVLVLIAGTLSLGMAMEKSGAAAYLAERIVDLTPATMPPPWSWCPSPCPPPARWP